MHVGFLARQLAQRGHNVTTITGSDSPLAHDLRAAGFQPLEFSQAGYFKPQSIARLYRYFASHPVDVVHSHYSRDLWTIVPALKSGRVKSRLPLLLTKHIGTGKPKRDFLHRWLYQRVDYLIAISEVIRQNLIATHPLSSEKVGVIHHGIDLEQFSLDKISDRSVRQELGFSHEQVVVGMVGRLQISKGCLEFLEMARRVHHEYPQTRFVVIGEATRGEPRDADFIRAKQHELQLEKVVTFLGFRKDIPAVLAAMDIFVFPSHAEAFGLALLEAMAAGKAVVASNNDGVLDIVADGVNGLLVPPRAVAALTYACLRLVEDATLRQRMGQAGREIVEQKFSVQHMLERLEILYERLQARAALAAGRVREVS